MNSCPSRHIPHSRKEGNQQSLHASSETFILPLKTNCRNQTPRESYNEILSLTHALSKKTSQSNQALSACPSPSSHFLTFHSFYVLLSPKGLVLSLIKPLFFSDHANSLLCPLASILQVESSATFLHISFTFLLYVSVSCSPFK